MAHDAPPAGLPSGPEAPHLWDYVAVLFRRRRAAATVLLAVVALAGLRVLLVRPVYRATAQVLIERDNPNVLTFKEVAEVDAGRDDYYQTQYTLLRGRVLARRVIDELHLFQQPELGGPHEPAQLEALKTAAPGASPVMEEAIDRFLARLNVQPVRNSRLVSVSFDAYRPELAARVANRLSQLYIQQTLEFRYQTSSEAGQWLGDQIASQRKKVAEAEVALQKVKEREGIVNIEERRSLLEQKLKELGTTLTNLKTTRLQREALFIQMRSAGNAEELPEVLRSPVVQSLRIELATLERRQAQLLEQYLDEHPEVVQVRNQIRDTRAKIAAESRRVIRAAENDYKAAAAQEASVAGALEAAKAEALELSRRGVQYDSLKHELDAAKQVLESILSRHKEMDVASELKSSNIRIVDPAAVPQQPIRPRRVRDLLIGLLIGVAGAVAMAFVLEYLDNSIKSAEDVRAQLGVPLLGIIPQVQGGNADLVLSPRTGQPFLEAYRALRTALNYSWPEEGCRVVLVTSTAPGEGKTVSAVNLCLSLAATGARVLLVDADMRKPRAHTLLQLRRGPGLSDVLVGRAKPSEVIQRRGSGFSVMTSGTAVPSPADLLTTETTKLLLGGLRSYFDWVIVDTPPVAAVAEPLILAPLSDGAIVVVAVEMVSRYAIRRTLESVTAAGTRLLGVVLNKMPVDKLPGALGAHLGRYGRYGSYGAYGAYGSYGEDRAVVRETPKVTSIHGGRRARH